jgi:hypothetical protein
LGSFSGQFALLFEAFGTVFRRFCPRFSNSTGQTRDGGRQEAQGGKTKIMAINRKTDAKAKIVLDDRINPASLLHAPPSRANIPDIGCQVK